MFQDAQTKHTADPDFYAPVMDELKETIRPGDLIKVCETDADGTNGERYWVKVDHIDYPIIYGRVRNELICHDRKLHSHLFVTFSEVYDHTPQKSYIGVEGKSTPNVGRVIVRSEDMICNKLDPRYDLVNHSPDGFAWGYTGSGPAQLALAILAGNTDAETALTHYQRFKEDVIGKLQGNWQLTETQVVDWLADAKLK